MSLREIVEITGRTYELTWEKAAILPPRDQITQVSAVCYSCGNRIVMISSDGHHWGIPGGHPEPSESLETALRREVREEACCGIREAQLIGWQHVRDMSDGSVHYQLRYCCRVDVGEFWPRHEIAHRRLVSPAEFLDVLEYGTSPLAREMFALAEGVIGILT